MIEAYFVTWFWKNLIWMCWMGQIIYFWDKPHGF